MNQEKGMRTEFEAFLDRFLQEVRKTLLEREKAYGPPERSFSVLREFWSQALRQDLSAPQIVLLLALLKTSRLAWDEEQPDSWIDLAGSAILGAYLQGRGLERCE
jgi:hypothetical protein